MKNEFSVAKIAAELGVSPKTVYRAINRSGMVKSSTQKYILDYIHANYSENIAPAQAEMRVKVITVVVQRKPTFFWQPIINEMQNAISAYPQDSIRLRTICFSGVRNDAELRIILSQVSPQNTDGLIVVPVNSKACLKTLRQMADQFPVVILDDYFDCDDTQSPQDDNFYYVHGDGRHEGAEVADLVAMSVLEEKNILILNMPSDSCHCQDRIKGFREQIARYSNCRVVDELNLSHLLPEEYYAHTSLPSQLSRELSKYMVTHPECKINCLYIPDGLLSQVCAAQVKLRERDIHCFGHEINDTAQRFFDSGIHGGYVNNDIQFQGHTAIRILAEKLLYGREPQKRKYTTPFTSALISD